MDIDPEQIQALQDALKVIYQQAPEQEPTPSPSATLTDRLESQVSQEKLAQLLKQFLLDDNYATRMGEIIQELGPERPPQKPWFGGHKDFPFNPRHFKGLE